MNRIIVLIISTILSGFCLSPISAQDQVTRKQKQTQSKVKTQPKHKSTTKQKSKSATKQTSNTSKHSYSQPQNNSKLTIYKLNLCNTDKNGNLISSSTDQRLIAKEMRYLNPTICYEGLTSPQNKHVYVKIFKPDGSLLNTEPNNGGICFSQDVTFDAGSNCLTLKGWGNAYVSCYTAGTHRYEVWFDGQCQYTKYFDILPRRLEIYAAKFANAEKSGNLISSAGETLYSSNMRYLIPYISYRGLTSPETKTVNLRITRPNGEVMKCPESPAGYTISFSATFETGERSQYLTSYGNATRSTYTPGSYKYELFIDGDLVYQTWVTIN